MNKNDKKEKMEIYLESSDESNNSEKKYKKNRHKKSSNHSCENCKNLKDVNYNVNQKVKNLEKKFDSFITFYEETMNKWMGIFKNTQDDIKKIDFKIGQIERDIKYIKNKKTNESSSQLISSTSNENLNNFSNNSSNNIKKTISNNYLAKLSIDNDLSPSKKSDSSSDLEQEENKNYYNVKKENTYLAALSSRNKEEDNEFSPIQLKRINSNLINNNETQLTIYNPANIALGKLYRSIKPDSFLHIPDDFIKKCLEMGNMGGDIKLFTKMYIENVPKEYIPIRHIKRSFQYWIDDHMQDDDLNATYIRTTIVNNMEKMYKRVNLFELYGDNGQDQFLANQEHIEKMSEEKYKEKFIQNIIPLISLN
jgi:hypothetical protein